MPLAAGGVAGVSGNPALLHLGLHAEVGDEVAGPDAIFATPLAELVVRGRDLREARAISSQMLAELPRVTAAARFQAGLT